MSLVVQSLSNGNTLTAGGTTTTSGTTSAVPFAQALVQTMTGNAATTASPTAEPLMSDLTSLLQGLLKEVQTTVGEKGSENENAALLEQITSDMSQLDESISSDPALLASLQGWLLQVSTLLSGANVEVDSGSADGIENLTPLAQNAETLRFAVQDDFNSLLTMIQEAAAQGNEETVGKGVELLNSFSTLLNQTTSNGNKTKASNVVNNTDVSIGQTQVADSKGEIKANVLNHLNNQSQNASVLKKETVLTSSTMNTSMSEAGEAELTNAPITKGTVVGEMIKSDSTQETTPEVVVVSGDNEVITAGQLSLRGGITAPLKAEVPIAPVPVQQFAQEMSGFITGKLEIVQKGGIAEATISLFPENLGQVDVKITMQNGHLVAQFMTEHSGAKDLLEQQMNQLRSALLSQGLQVEKLEVTQNNTPLNSQWGQEGRQPGSGSGQQGRRSKESREEASDAVLAAELNGEWKDWVSNSGQEDQNQTGSFSAKA